LFISNPSNGGNPMPTPEELMDKGKKLLTSKAQDYTSGDTTRYENFERQAEIMSWFGNNWDKAFVGLIAVKLARLASLLDKEDKPNHESIEDTFIDLINYSALWGGFRTRYTPPAPPHPFSKPEPF
jgi:hypothetical protein